MSRDKTKTLFYGLRIEQLAAVNRLAEQTGLKPYEVAGRLIDLALDHAKVKRVSIMDIVFDPKTKETEGGE